MGRQLVACTAALLAHTGRQVSNTGKSPQSKSKLIIRGWPVTREGDRALTPDKTTEEVRINHAKNL